jgi:hypothetical protein
MTQIRAIGSMPRGSAAHLENFSRDGWPELTGGHGTDTVPDREAPGLYEGIVSKRKVLPAGAVVVEVLVPHGPQPSPDQAMYPAAGSLHALPFDGSEHCFHCNWHKLHWLAGEGKGPFTGSPEEE